MNCILIEKTIFIEILMDGDGCKWLSCTNIPNFLDYFYSNIPKFDY